MSQQDKSILKRTNCGYANARIDFDRVGRTFRCVSNTELLGRFLINPRFAANTRRSYGYTLRDLDRFVNKPWREVTVGDIDAFLRSKNAPASRQTYLSCIKAFLKWIHDDDLPKEIRHYQIRCARK
jgi:site-specific recombinase XerD